MGNSLEESRNTPIPENIDDFYDNFRRGWLSIEYQYEHNNNQSTMVTTLGTDSLNKVANIITDWLIDNNTIIPKILEIGAGNGIATQLIKNHIISKINDILYIATDLRSNIENLEIIGDLTSVDAVQTFGDETNILLFISPPPYSIPVELNDKGYSGKLHGYMDYFAIKEWTKLISSEYDRYIIYVGELGASDGSTGMYRYMMTHRMWRCMLRDIIVERTDMFGGPLIKEIFIFKSQIGQ
jgi:hypothetical protein